MIPLVRPVIDGELWWSVLARQSDHLQLTSPIVRQQMLVENKRSLGSPLFPRQIADTLKGLDIQIGVTAVIDGHTLLPYYASFLNSPKIIRAREHMTTNGHAEFVLGLAQMEDYPKRLKRCPVCVTVDIEKHGDAPWRRVHQAPGTVFCVHHDCALEVTDANARVQAQIAHFTTVDAAQRVTRFHVPDLCLPDVRWLAACARTLIETRSAAPGQARLASLYRRHLRAQDLIDEFDRLCLSDFVHVFVRRFTRLLPLIGCHRPDANDRDNWLARLVRAPRSEQSPLKHLLLMRFLGIEPTQALQEAIVLEPYTSRPARARPAQKRSRRVTAATANDKRKRWLSLLASSRSGPLRKRNDTLYCWLWRNERAWLRQNVRPKSKLILR